MGTQSWFRRGNGDSQAHEAGTTPGKESEFRRAMELLGLGVVERRPGP